MAAGATRAALERSLAALGTEYVDLYLIHWPLPRLGQSSHAFLAMAELAAEGLIRSIGVSNFQAKHIAQLVAETGLTPVVDQIECDPTIQRRALRRELHARGIVAQAWSPLGRGGPLLSDPVVLRAAESAGCTPGQVVLRWHRAKGIVPIVKSASPHRQEENLAAVGNAPAAGRRSSPNSTASIRGMRGSAASATPTPTKSSDGRGLVSRGRSRRRPRCRTRGPW